jgi:hypothetical protein
MFKTKASSNFNRNKILIKNLNGCCDDFKRTSSYKGKGKIERVKTVKLKKIININSKNFSGTKPMIDFKMGFFVKIILELLLWSTKPDFVPQFDDMYYKSSL